MKKIALASLLFASLTLTAGTAMAAGRIAFVDREGALLASKPAQDAQSRLQVELKPQRDRLEQLQKDIRGYEDKFKKDGATMSDSQKKALNDQAGAKMSEYNNLIQQSQKRVADAQQDLLNKTLPTINKTLDDLRKEGGYDMILDSRAVVYGDPANDLTQKLTDRLNAQ